MKKDLFKVARRLAVYLLCISLLFADSARMGSNASESDKAMNKESATIVNEDTNVAVVYPEDSLYVNSNYNLVYQSMSGDELNHKANLKDEYVYLGGYLIYLFSDNLPFGSSYDGYSLQEGKTATVKIPFQTNYSIEDIEVVMADCFQIPASIAKEEEEKETIETKETETMETGTETTETETTESESITESESTEESGSTTEAESAEESGNTIESEDTSTIEESQQEIQPSTEETQNETSNDEGTLQNTVESTKLETLDASEQNKTMDEDAEKFMSESIGTEIDFVTVLMKEYKSDNTETVVLENVDQEDTVTEEDDDLTSETEMNEETVTESAEETPSVDETQEKEVVERTSSVQNNTVAPVAVENTNEIQIDTTAVVSYKIEDGCLVIETRRLGTFLVRLKLDVAKKKLLSDDYQKYMNTPFSGDVAYFTATMFNYESDYIKRLSQGKGLQFNTGNGSPYYNSNNGGDGSGTGKDAATQGLVEKTLGADGNPVFTMEGTPQLFDTSNKVASEVYTVDFPFEKQQDGYYLFDSDSMYVMANEEYYTQENGVITGYTLHDTAPATLKGAWNLKGFWPFSYKDNTKDFHFGMRLDVEFLIPKYLDDSAEDPMTFEFSGDDDVWVFIDDQLVLDIGGIHGKVSGKIDFNKDEVSISRVVDLSKKNSSVETYTDAKLSDLLGETEGDKGYKDGEIHKMSIFYMERGSYESNCRIKFNLLAKTTEQEQLVTHKTARVKSWEDRTYDVVIDAESFYSVEGLILNDQDKYEEIDGSLIQPSEVNHIMIRDVVDDRFVVTAVDGVSVDSLPEDVSITEYDGKQVVTWKNQSTKKNTEDEETKYTLSHTITIQAKDTYFGGNDVTTNYNAPYENDIHMIEDQEYMSSYVMLSNGMGYELEQPLVNVKTADQIDGAFDVIFRGEKIGEEIDENEVVVRYFTEEDFEKFISTDQNGNITKIGECTDLRDISVKTYSFYQDEITEEIAIEQALGEGLEGAITKEQLLEEKPENDCAYPFVLIYQMNSDGASKLCQSSMAKPDENGSVQGEVDGKEYPYYLNAQQGTVSSSYRVYVYGAEIAVTKAIAKQDIEFLQGDPIFTFKLVNEATGRTYYRLVRFDKNHLEEGADGNVNLTATFENLPEGKYILSELDTMRYTLDEISSVLVNGVTDYEINGAKVAGLESNLIIASAKQSGIRAEYIFSRPEFEEESLVIADQNRKMTGTAIFENRKYQDDYDSDTDVVVNHFTLDQDGNLVITPQLKTE